LIKNCARSRQINEPLDYRAHTAHQKRKRKGGKRAPLPPPPAPHVTTGHKKFLMMYLGDTKATMSTKNKQKNKSKKPIKMIPRKWILHTVKVSSRLAKNAKVVDG